MFNIRCYKLAAFLAIGSVLTSPTMAQPFGLVADHFTNSVNVFDVGTNSVEASIPIGAGQNVGDTAITPNQLLGFATDFLSQVWVIDLMTSPPSLATGTNPIPISNPGEDLSVTPDGRFLLVSDGSLIEPISVIDIAARAEISAFLSGTSTNSLDVCDDGTTVLVTSVSANDVRRLALDPVAGTLSATADVLPLGFDGPNNVHCAPGSGSGVVVTRFSGAVRSFIVPGLSPVDTRTLANVGISAVFSPAGDRVFVRNTIVSPGREPSTPSPTTRQRVRSAPCRSVPWQLQAPPHSSGWISWQSVPAEIHSTSRKVRLSTLLTFLMRPI